MMWPNMANYVLSVRRIEARYLTYSINFMKKFLQQIVVYAFADYSDAPVAMICFWPNDGNFESGIYELIPLDKNLALMGFVNFSIDVHSFCESCKIYQKISRTAAS